MPSLDMLAAANGISLESLSGRWSLEYFRQPFTYACKDWSPERAWIFVGQLPFQFPASAVGRLVQDFGGADHVYDVEIIYQVSSKTHLKEPKGCARVEIDAWQVQFVMANLHQLFLFVDNELLYGATETLQAIQECLSAQTTKNLQKLLVCEPPKKGARPTTGYLLQ
jgi:hypothetical protein